MHTVTTATTATALQILVTGKVRYELVQGGGGRVGVVGTCPRARRTNVCSTIPNQCSPASDDAAEMVVQDATEPQAKNDDDEDGEDDEEFAAAVAHCCARQMAL